MTINEATANVMPIGEDSGYIAKKGNQYYAVIYEGLDPVTGKEIRTWHPAGTNKAKADQLARKLAAEIGGANDAVRSLTFGAFLVGQWLPGKANTLAASRVLFRRLGWRRSACRGPQPGTTAQGAGRVRWLLGRVCRSGSWPRLLPRVGR